MPAANETLPAAQAGTFAIGGDLTVNRMGYGAMRITGKGIWGPPADRDAAIATLRRAVELGVNLIDTADSYGPYVSEELIAEALYPYPPGLVITTKVGWERHGPGVWGHNASPAHIEKAIAGSLARLRLERIDVYQLHVPDPATSFDASIEAIARLKDQGKVRHVALSNVTLEHIKRAQKIVPIVSVQNRYSFPGDPWPRRAKRMKWLRRLRPIAAHPLPSFRWPGCCAVRRSFCPSREPVPSSISKRM